MEQIDYTLLYRIAKNYYIDGMTQKEIAKRENISRPHVSRMLAKARATGIVAVEIRMPEQTDVALLQDALQQKLGLRDVYVASCPSDKKVNAREQSLSIAATAAAIMPDLLRNARTVGVGWGYTVYQTALLLERAASAKPLNFVPLVGLSGENNPYLQINVIVNRFAEKYSAQSFYTIMPVIRENQMKMRKTEQESYLRLRQQWERMDAAVIGLGSSPKSGTKLVSEASTEYHDRVAESGTVGDILANFFYEDGHCFDTSDFYQHIAFTPSELTRVDTVICLSGGIEKVPGIIAGARNRFFNILVTDSLTAQQILDCLDDN